MQQVLDDPALLKQFSNFASKEHSEENLSFYLAAQQYKSLPVDKLQAEALVLYAKFIKPNSDYELPIDGQTKAQITQRLEEKKESGEQIRNLFLQASQLALEYMKADVFR